MADFSRTGRGAALLKVLEQPVRKPGQQPKLSAEGFVTESDGKTLPQFSSGRGMLFSKPPPLAQPSLPSSPALSGVSGSHQTTTFGRGLLQHAKTFHSSVPESTLTPPLSQQSSQLTPIEPQVPANVLTPPLSQLSLESKGRYTSGPLTPLSQSALKSASSPTATTKPTSPTSSKLLMSAESKMGKTGTSIPLGVNYLALKASPEAVHVYQYAVSFSPPVESRNMRYGMLNEHAELIGTTKAFDGAILFLPKKITDTSVSCNNKRITDGVDITVTITLTNELRLSDCLQLFNIIIRRVLRCLNLSQLGRQYYDQHHSILVPQHKMELWPGYVTAIHEFDGGLLLLLDVSHKLLRIDSALDFLYDLNHSKPQNFQEEAERQLVGTVVVTRYNNRTYRIDDIAWDKNPKSTFTDHTDKSVSFVEYYKSAYNKDIQDTEQPLLIHRPRQKRMPKKDGVEQEQPDEVICLIPELCSMTGLTDAARNDFKVMKDLAQYTRLTPDQRDRAIKKFVVTVNANPKAKSELESWGLSLHPTMLTTTGRCLSSEKILFKDRSAPAGPDADWGKHVVKENVISAVPLNDWVVVFFKRDSPRAMEFVSMLMKVTPAMGIKVKDPTVIEIPNDRTETYIRAIRDQVRPSLQMVVIIFPSQRDDRYSSVKKLCCVESPVPSQVINSRTISQPQKLRSVTQKIALQMNCKMGGELWALDIPLKNLMVIGIDVYHDSAAGKRSVIAIVSSTNRHMTRWYSRVFIQDRNQEVADSLIIGFHSALTRYHEVNQTLPERIIVFRDGAGFGVGVGQMNVVDEFEVPQMKKCFQMFGENYKPKLGVVVVQKRISTRIFGKCSGGYDNPPPGTVLDHSVTRKGWYDFFLVSQHVRQGTVTPTHYCIVTDSTNLAPDHMQRLTYKLTHLYYNWPGTVRVPAPCQYAHKLAFLVGQSLHKAPSPDICDRLFFL